MTDTEKIVKINEMVETYCTSWNGNMKAALKNAMKAIVYVKTDVPEAADAESYQAYIGVLAILTFMEDSFFLSEYQSSKLSDFAADLHYSW